VDLIRITDRIWLHEDELEEHFVRASGPGGQNVNKLATAVQLRFDARRSPSLPEDVRDRLMALAGRRLTGAGAIVITAQTHRTQEQNRRAARERLIDLIRRAAVAPKRRKATKPSRAAKRERLEHKVRHGRKKSLRGRVDWD
jgi:ribosome-associated protein